MLDSLRCAPSMLHINELLPCKLTTVQACRCWLCARANYDVWGPSSVLQRIMRMLYMYHLMGVLARALQCKHGDGKGRMHVMF